MFFEKVQVAFSYIVFIVCLNQQVAALFKNFTCDLGGGARYHGQPNMFFYIACVPSAKRFSLFGTPNSELPQFLRVHVHVFVKGYECDSTNGIESDSTNGITIRLF